MLSTRPRQQQRHSSSSCSSSINSSINSSNNSYSCSSNSNCSSNSSCNSISSSSSNSTSSNSSNTCWPFPPDQSHRAWVQSAWSMVDPLQPLSSVQLGRFSYLASYIYILYPFKYSDVHFSIKCNAPETYEPPTAPHSQIQQQQPPPPPPGAYYGEMMHGVQVSDPICIGS